MKQLLTTLILLSSLQLWSTSILTVPNVDFAKGSYEIDSIGHKNINRIVEILNKYEVILSVELGGHQDSIENGVKDTTLSWKRANAVLSEIEKRYSGSCKLSIKAFGTSALFTMDTTSSLKHNRRVVMKILEIRKPRFNRRYFSSKDTLDHYHISIKPICENLYLHTSYLRPDSLTKIPCNGLIFMSDDDAFVFDAPTNDSASQELINWCKSKYKKVIGVVSTHRHTDCVGGLGTFQQKNIPTYATEQTITLAKENNEAYIPRDTISKNDTIYVGAEFVILRYFGEGHTIDNIVGYIPDEETLFGGCLIKPLNGQKGYLGDANINEWSNTVRKVKAAYPNLQTVVPGHGDYGDTSLLDYTIELFDHKTDDQIEHINKH